MQNLDEETTPYMSYSYDGTREREQGNAFLSMATMHHNRIYAAELLLDMWERNPDAKVWLDSEEFHPTDEEVAEIEERQEAWRQKHGVHRETAAVLPEPDNLVHVQAEIEEVLEEERAPMQASLRDAMRRFERRKRTVKKCKPGGKRPCLTAK